MPRPPPGASCRRRQAAGGQLDGPRLSDASCKRTAGGAATPEGQATFWHAAVQHARTQAAGAADDTRQEPSRARTCCIAPLPLWQKKSVAARALPPGGGAAEQHTQPKVRPVQPPPCPASQFRIPTFSQVTAPLATAHPSTSPRLPPARLLQAPVWHVHRPWPASFTEPPQARGGVQPLRRAAPAAAAARGPTSPPRQPRARRALPARRRSAACARGHHDEDAPTHSGASAGACCCTRRPRRRRWLLCRLRYTVALSAHATCGSNKGQARLAQRRHCSAARSRAVRAQAHRTPAP